MSCHVALRRDYAPFMSFTDDLVATFLDLARQGDEVTFKELACCLGLGVETADEFWRATVTRAGSRIPPSQVR